MVRSKTEIVARHTFVSENFTVIRRLVKSGIMAGTIIAEYKMYTTFLSRTEESKMDRYEKTAELCGCGARTVMNAVKNMQSAM